MVGRGASRWFECASCITIKNIGLGFSCCRIVVFSCFHPTLFPDTQISCASQVGFYHLLEALLLGPHFPSPRLCGVIIISVRTIWPSTVPEFLYWYHLHSTAVLYFLPIKDAYWGWAKLTFIRPIFLLLLASIYLLFQWWSLPMFWFLILHSPFQVARFKCLHIKHCHRRSSTKFCATISSTSQATVCLQYLTLLTFCSLNICVLVSWMCWTFGQLFETCTNDININPIKLIYMYLDSGSCVLSFWCINGIHMRVSFLGN